MTRFLISLDEAVDTVFAVIKDGKAGDTFVPCAPSATVENIAKALVGDRKIEIKVTGIRPGEKLHEIMISEEEVNHCNRVGNYFSIRSMLPELSGEESGPNELNKEYSSADNVLDLEGTVKLLEKHSLLNFDPKQFENTNELLK